MPITKTEFKIEQLYDPADFRRWGHALIDLLADSFEQSINEPDNNRVIPYRPPEEELAFWQKDLEEGGSVLELFSKILDHSSKVHNPRYMGHQLAIPAFVASLSGLMTDSLSNGTGVYEMGMASNALEKVLTDFMAAELGYTKDAAGFITSGGTLANLTALLAARKAKAPEVWEEGHNGQLALMVSAEAHYCVDRAARILGMGSQGIIKVPVDELFKIRTDLLEDSLAKAKADGLKVIAVIGCAGSTATGSYDDLEALAAFSQKHNMWYHVDGAHGGPVVLSEQYRHLAKGIDQADSVVIDFHKMMLTPALNTALIFQRGADSYKTFVQQAQYLWAEQESPEWYHSGKRTFECTKLMLSTKVYAILRTYGKEAFVQNIDQTYGTARQFAEILRSHPHFELAHEPESNIVNYRYSNAALDQLDVLNSQIRQRIMEDGRFYIVQTLIDGKRYLRSALMNPMTSEDDLFALLDEIENIANNLK